MDTLVLINPDNPSGYYMGQSEIAALLQWCKKENKILIVDESFWTSQMKKMCHYYQNVF